jgi:hypothetical protein
MRCAERRTTPFSVRNKTAADQKQSLKQLIIYPAKLTRPVNNHSDHARREEHASKHVDEDIYCRTSLFFVCLFFFSHSPYRNIIQKSLQYVPRMNHLKPHLCAHLQWIFNLRL